MNIVKVKHHIEALQTKHRVLDEQINKMESNGLYEDEELHQLKKRRLALKDEITALEHTIHG